MAYSHAQTDEEQADNWTTADYNAIANPGKHIGEVFTVTGHYTKERHEQMGGDQLVIETDRGDVYAPSYYDVDDIGALIGETVQIIDGGSAETGSIAQRKLRLQAQ